MDEYEAEASEELPLEGAGQHLRRVREEQGLQLEQVAAETRIPIRHLEVIERGAFNELPAKTYAVGFSRTYAKMLKLDEKDIAQRVRDELAQQEEPSRERGMSFEPGDPAKVPSSGLAWAGGLAAIILFAGAVAFYSTYYGVGEGPGPLLSDPEPVLAQDNAEQSLAPRQASLGADRSVVFTALEDGIWVRFYDADGTKLLEKQMASGERFEIPTDAQEPRINTGRPDAFAITIGGQEVPKLAEVPVTIGDAPVSAAALLARAEEIPGLPGESVEATFN